MAAGDGSSPTSPRWRRVARHLELEALQQAARHVLQHTDRVGERASACRFEAIESFAAAAAFCRGLAELAGNQSARCEAIERGVNGADGDAASRPPRDGFANRDTVGVAVAEIEE